jgi:hypothetical protein
MSRLISEDASLLLLGLAESEKVPLFPLASRSIPPKLQKRGIILCALRREREREEREREKRERERERAHELKPPPPAKEGENSDVL